MSNTPTESEFDKELDRALTNHRIWVYGVLSERNDKTLTQEEFVRENARYQAQTIKAIKQAVDKHVIGEDDKNYPFAESEIVNIEGYNTLMGGRNLLRREQRVALYGGDKK